MGIVIRQGIQSTVAAYIGVLLGFLNFLILFPLVLTKQEIGLVRVLEESTSMIATLAMAGAPNLCIRFFPYFKDNTRGHNGFLWLLLALPTLGIAVVGAGLWLLRGYLYAAYAHEPLLLQYAPYILPITACTMYFLVLEAYCKSNFYAVVPVLFKEAAKRVILIVASLLLFYGVLHFEGFMRWFLAVHFVILGLLVAYTYHIGLFRLRQSPWHLLTPKLRYEMVDFSLFVLLGNLGGLLIGKIDTLMLGAMVGLDDTGVYGMAAKLILLIDMPRAAIQQIVLPLVATAYKTGDMAQIAALYQKTALNQLIVGAGLLLVLWACANDVFWIIPNGNLYRSGVFVILYLGIAKVIDMGAGINYEILAFSKYYRMSAFLNLGLTVVAIGINYFCIVRMGFMGAAVAAIGVVLLFNIVRGGFVYYALHIQPFSYNTLKVIALSSVIFLISWAIPHFATNRLSAILDAGLHTAVIVALFGGAVLYFNLSEDITGSFQKNYRRFFS